MQLRSDSFPDHGPIPGEFAFCVPADEGHVSLAPNRNPHLAWTDAPAGTRSFALIVHDPDVPSRGDDVNREGRSVPASLPRVDYFHWVLVDIPVDITEIAAASHSDGVTAHGKPPGRSPLGYGLQGINDYTGWFAGDPAMSGEYAGYDGPCPPWNDELLHHYHFTIYALDVESLALEPRFTGQAALEAIAGHVLAQATHMGTYTLNPALRSNTTAD